MAAIILLYKDYMELGILDPGLLDGIFQGCRTLPTRAARAASTQGWCVEDFSSFSFLPTGVFLEVVSPVLNLITGKH